MLGTRNFFTEWEYQVTQQTGCQLRKQSHNVLQGKVVLSLLTIAVVAALASPVLGDVFKREVASWMLVMYDLRRETSEGEHMPQCISLLLWTVQGR